MTREEANIIIRILSLRFEPWFIDGEDCPEDIREEILEFEEDIKRYQGFSDVTREGLEWAAGGPGYTDMWIKEGLLIGDIRTKAQAEQIERDNIQSFKDERTESIIKLRNILPALFKIPGVSLERILEILKERGIV